MSIFQYCDLSFEQKQILSTFNPKYNQKFLLLTKEQNLDCVDFKKCCFEKSGYLHQHQNQYFIIVTDQHDVQIPFHEFYENIVPPNVSSRFPKGVRGSVVIDFEMVKTVASQSELTAEEKQRYNVANLHFFYNKQLLDHFYIFWTEKKESTQHQLEKLQKRIELLEQIIFAPGGPAFLIAKQSYKHGEQLNLRRLSL